MKRYKAVLFDADGTLFDYDKAERHALRETLGLYALPMTEKHLRAFRRIREEQEALYEKGEISQAAQASRRFALFTEETRLPPDPMELASLYAAALEKHIELHDGALEICQKLCKSIPLYLITNGQTAIQRARVTASPVISFLTGMFISEEVGFPKPHKYFFDSVMLELEDTGREEILVAGDCLSCDIAGGHAAGMDTCWYNPREKPNPGTLQPTYEIRRLAELAEIVEI